MKSFLIEYLRTITNPRSTFENLTVNDKSLNSAFIYIFIPIFFYTLMYIFLTIGHGAPEYFTPWLNISKEDYYSINRFLLAPSMIVCWFTATSFIQVSSRFLGGRGSFETTLTAVALSISIAMWGGLIHDVPMSLLSAIGVINAQQHEIDMNSPTVFRWILWLCYFVYLSGFIILFPLTVRVIHQLNWIKSSIIGILAFAIFQLLFLVFNR